MNPNLERALLLYQQSRYELAEEQLRQALAAEPDDSYAHAMLALCLANREQFKDATAEAQQAIHLQPDSDFAHYAHARVLLDRNHLEEAQAAIEEAIRLDPGDADYLSLLSSIHFREARWKEALAAAERGLQSDPEHIGCTNLRAMAMVKLGRRAEAGATIDAALAKNPENSSTHANQGWTLLEKGEPKKALEHFRESLRLDPENEWARQGIVEALKARNVIYACMLKYFLWMSRFSRRGQWAIILGAFFGNRLLGAVAAAQPEFAPWILPVQILYVCFALMTWVAYPFFNLLLRLDPFGRLVLSREQTIASTWLGLCLLVALIALAACILNDFKDPWFAMLMVFGFLLLPVSAVFRCPSGRPRNIMAALTIILVVLGVAAIVLTVPAVQRSRQRDGNAGSGLFGLVLLGSVASTWVTNIVRTQTRRR